MEVKGLTNTKCIWSAKDLVRPEVKQPIETLDILLKTGERCPMLEEKIFFEVIMKLSMEEIIAFKYVRNSLFRMTDNEICINRFHNGGTEWNCKVYVSIAEAIATIYELTQPIMRKEIPSIITSIEKVINEFIRLITPKGKDFDTSGIDENTEFDAEALSRDMEKENIHKCLSNGLHTNYMESIPCQNSEKENHSELMKALISERPDCVLSERLAPAASRLLIPCELLNSMDADETNDLFIFLTQLETDIMDIHLFDYEENYRAYQIDVYHVPESHIIKTIHEKTLKFALSKLNQ